MDAIKDWKMLRLHLARFLIRFGWPDFIARKRWISRWLRDSASGLLRELEEVARRLLVRDALNAPPENAIFRPARQPYPSYRCGRPGFASEDSADWGVCFRLTPPPRHRKSQRNARRGAFSPWTVGSCGLAERLEALLRVAGDPARWARRLALRWRAKPEAALASAERMLRLDRPPLWRAPALRAAFFSSA